MVSDGMPHIDDPRTIRDATFSTSFRGFDQLEVRAFLQTLARQLSDIDDLRAEAEAKVEQAQQELEAAKEIDESVLMARLGDDATAILQTARDQAAERLAQADQEVAELRSRVDSEVAAIREASEQQASEMLADVETKQRELDAALDNEQQTRERHRAEALAEAERDAETLRAKAREQGDEIVAEAREEGRAMVAEARIVRERILADLSRRRTNAKVQLEQLRAGRQRLIEAIDVTTEAVTDVNRELANSLPEARLAAETAGLTVASPASVAEIESEIESARLVGNPFVSSDEVAQALAGDTSGEPEATDVEMVGDGYEETRDDRPLVDVDATDEDSDVEDRDFDSPGLVLAELGDDRAKFRRKKNLPPVADELPRDEVPTVELEADFEQVRALDPTIELEPVSGPVEVDHQSEPAAEVRETDETDETDETEENDESDELEAEVAELDEPVEDVDEGHPEIEAVAPVVSLAPELPADVSEDQVSEDLVSEDLDEQEPEIEEPVEEEPAVAEVAAEDAADQDRADSDPADDDVDALFDRLRADREQRTAHAAAVLAAADDPAEPEVLESELAEPEQAEPEVEPATSDVAEPEATEPEPEPELEPATLEAVPALVDDTPTPVGEETASERFQNLEQALAERRASLAELEKSVGRKLKRTLAEEQNELLDLVRRGEAAAGTSLESLVGADEDHGLRYIDAVAPQLQTAAAAGAGSVGGQAPSIDREAARHVVADEWLSSMRLLIERVLADGDDPDDVIEHLRSLYREVKGQRMSSVASSLVVSAYNVGVHAGLAAERTVRWELAPDSDCGQDCTDNLVGGPITAGTAFPSGHLHPPAAAGCRCLLVAEDDLRSQKIS